MFDTKLIYSYYVETHDNSRGKSFLKFCLYTFTYYRKILQLHSKNNKQHNTKIRYFLMDSFIAQD